jgi:NTE family protein
MRVGLVLGAGGVIGGSWLIGALEALEAETGWRAQDAEQIVGTSAGAVIGALAAAGVAPEYMSAYASGRTLDDVADAESRASVTAARASAGQFQLQWSLPPIGPGSWQLAVSTLLRPHRHAPAVVLAGWLPRGFVSTAPIRRLVEAYVPDRWPERAGFWAVAADYATGRRVAFGRDDAPPATLGEAVAASCAIPGFYHPVRVAGRRYIDGGICSVSNLDLLKDVGLDLVVCLNPMSSLAQATGGSPADRMAAVMRASAGRRLAHEGRKAAQRGHRGARPPAGPSRHRAHGLQPHERHAARRGHGAGAAQRRAAPAPAARPRRPAAAAHDPPAPGHDAGSRHGARTGAGPPRGVGLRARASCARARWPSRPPPCRRGHRGAPR